MTTVYELEKQATPGPWVVDGKFFPDEKDIEANQRMITHCRNHFMEALEALKEITGEIEQLSIEAGRSVEYGGLVDRTRLKIKKLETVE